MMKSYKGIIFDMDGVLIDSEPLHLRAWEKCVQKFGIVFNPAPLEQWIGVPDNEIAKTLIQNNNSKVDPKLLLLEKKTQFIKVNNEIDQVLFPGVYNALKSLKGYRLGLATSTERELTDYFLRKAGIDIFFDVTVTSTEVTLKKPHPEPYLSAAAKMLLTPGSCIVVEDTGIGIEAARQAGMYVLAVENSFAAKDLKGADMYFQTTCKAIEWLLNSN